MGTSKLRRVLKGKTSVPVFLLLIFGLVLSLNFLAQADEPNKTQPQNPAQSPAQSSTQTPNPTPGQSATQAQTQTQTQSSGTTVSQENEKPYNGKVELESKAFPETNKSTQKPEESLHLNADKRIVVPVEPVKPPLVKGVYVNSWLVGSDKKIEELIQLARTTEINCFVIDIKDDSGFISFPNSVALAAEAKATKKKNRDFKGLVQRLKKEHIYLIGRIVTFKDSTLANARPDRALKLTRGGKVYADDKWISPFLRSNWEYVVSLAKEGIKMGFDEIQFDYVRFPALGHGPIQVAQVSNMSKDQAIQSFLSYARKELNAYGAPVSADIFGMVTSVQDLGIGQRYDALAKSVDVLSPMVYPSHYSNGNFGIASPEKSPYQTVYRGIKDAVSRLPKDPHARIRPWLQDFSLRYHYGPSEVRAQIQALSDLGIHEWLLWNPGSRYTKSALLPEGSVSKSSKPSTTTTKK